MTGEGSLFAVVFVNFDKAVARVHSQSLKEAFFSKRVDTPVHVGNWVCDTDRYGVKFLIADTEYEQHVLFRCKYDCAHNLGIGWLDDIPFQHSVDPVCSESCAGWSGSITYPMHRSKIVRN